MNQELLDKAYEILAHYRYEEFVHVFADSADGRLLLALACNLLARYEPDYYDWKARFVGAAIELLPRTHWWIDQHERTAVVLAWSGLRPLGWAQEAQFAFHFARANDVAYIQEYDPPPAAGRRWAGIMLADYFFDLLEHFVATHD